jgi:hypothetical protein
MNHTAIKLAPCEPSKSDIRLKREKQIKKLIKKYEDTIFSFFRELRVPLKYREIIRAYILASGGETIFEASHKDLTNLLYKRSLTEFQTHKDTVRYHASGLQKWQRKHGVELVRLIKEGRKTPLPDGGYEYQTSQYELVLLDELVKVLYDHPAQGLEKRIQEAVSKMKAAYIPPPAKPKTPDYFMLQRDVKTIYTKIGKALEKAERLNMNPIEWGEKLLTDLQRGRIEKSAFQTS